MPRSRTNAAVGGRRSSGTSTLLAAWNAAVYLAQIEDDELQTALADGTYLDATREVLRRHGGLWFVDESYVIAQASLSEGRAHATACGRELGVRQA